MRNRLLSTALSAWLLFGATASGAQEISNPDLFDKSLKAAEQALAFYGAYDNPEEMRRVADIGYRVARESNFNKFPFSFYLADMPVPNAFALPGGHIFLTRGMLDLGLTDDMLAGLLGHEIGHVVREHGIRIQRRATLLNALSQALLLGVMISADSGGRSPVPGPAYDRGASPGDRVMGAAATGAVVTELLLRSYSREFEDEADDEGQRMAAAAGFDPDGTRQLMALMQERLPETKQYGYWRTHPFFDQRVRAAAIREEMLKVQEPEGASEYRQATQKVLLEFRDHRPPTVDPLGRHSTQEPETPKPEESQREPADLLKIAALNAWPIGPQAEQLRLERLHRIRDRQVEKRELYRDLGEVIESYREESRRVAAIDPDSKLLAEIEREISGFEGQLERLYPKAVEVFRQGVYETEFLETFASNFPRADELPEISLALGSAYARLGRQSEAVRHYLRAWRTAPESEPGRRARQGLRNLATVLDRLGPLQEIVELGDDSELHDLAANRLADRVKRFDKLDNGAEFLKRYPSSPHAGTVNERLNSLAENLYGEVVLYQAVGDHVKALERIQSILTDAPLSPAAEKLRSAAVVES